MARNLLSGFVQWDDSGNYTATTNNSAYVEGVSGDAHVFGFTSPISQTTSSLSVYIFYNSKGGSPTSTRMDIIADDGADPQRPDEADSIANDTIDVDAVSTQTWVTFSFASVTLVAGAWYWILIQNTTGTPATNFASFGRRCSLDAPPGGRQRHLTGVRSGNTITGLTSDPINVDNFAPCVIAFNDGTIIGCPWVRNTTPSGFVQSTDGVRGFRLQFTNPLPILYGFAMQGSDNSYENAKIHNGSVEVAISPGTGVWNRKYQPTSILTAAFDPGVNLLPGVDYDFVCDFMGNGAAAGWLYMGQSSPPADVKAAGKIFGNQPRAVWGTASELASGTLDSSDVHFWEASLWFDENFPAKRNITMIG